ncbi:hypothetical protein [Lonepinella sp. BR2271]|uniref:hypothetical protein n=1 Tax=Lonepinella sp. BR2271 TaxID=3434550 RepID=UPI003F6DD059
MRKDKKADQMERVAVLLLKNPKGITTLEATFKEYLPHCRNKVNELEHLLNVKFNRVWEKTADGTGQYYRYSIPNRETAEILADYATDKARERGAVIFNESQLLHILERFA